MKNKKRTIIITGTVLVGIVFVGLIYKIVTVNQKYPQTKIKNVAFGETADLKENLSLTVKKTEWMTNKEYIKAHEENMDVDSKTDAKIILVDVSIKNDSQKEKTLDLYNLYIEKQGYYNGLALDTFMELTGDKESSVLLKGGEELQTTLVYVIYSFQFKKKDWNKIENQRFYLVNSRYPVKICWDINEKSNEL
ncbi:MAG: hypothetical protein ACI4C5_07420 [Lachnospiraceae bacterium]